MPTQVLVPGLGESVSEAVLLKWHKQDGQAVAQDEPICELETEKANVDVPAPAAGVLTRGKAEGAKVRIGEAIASIDPNGKPTGATKTPIAAKPAPAQTTSPAAVPFAAKSTDATRDLSPAVRRLVEENRLDAASISASGPHGRLTKEDVLKHLETKQTATPASNVSVSAKPQAASKLATDVDPGEAAPILATPAATTGADGAVRRVPMSKIRKKIAERLVAAQHNAAILTTFNEVDLSAIMALRTKYKESFEKKYQIGLGFMSFFAKACTLALKEFERVNGMIEGDDVVLHDYVHLGIAVSTERGLAVPVLRNVQSMSFAKIESEIKRLAAATREGKLSLQELSGGTFTITNGGVFGSLVSTPILNPPQSAILGMHKIQERAVVIAGKIEVRPMMYLALSYDHRIIDGSESVRFLVRVKEYLEDPSRLMLEI